MESPQEFIDAGAWLGRHEAFAVIATQCTAVQAQCLRQARESAIHEKLGLTWDDLCKQYAGCGRSHADELIRRHQRFGDTYFRLSELARISPATFTQLSEAGHIHEDTLEVDGVEIPFTRENVPKIRVAIQRLRTRLNEAQAAAPANISIRSLQLQIEGYIKTIEEASRLNLADIDRASLKGLVTYSIDKLRAVSRAMGV